VWRVFSVGHVFIDLLLEALFEWHNDDLCRFLFDGSIVDSVLWVLIQSSSDVEDEKVAMFAVCSTRQDMDVCVLRRAYHMDSGEADIGERQSYCKECVGRQ